MVTSSSKEIKQVVEQVKVNGARGRAVLGRTVREGPSEKVAFSRELDEGRN